MEHIAEKVRNFMGDSLYRDDEVSPGTIPEGAVIVEGLQGKFGFHPGRLESHRAEIIAILQEMNPAFRKDGGGGFTFLNLCEDRNGVQWGEHRSCDELVMLAIGIGVAKYCFPRDMWGVLPGGMPYIIFDLPPLPETANGASWATLAS